MKRILAIDAGTEQSGYCIMEVDTYKPVMFGKIDNDELLSIVLEGCYDALVYDSFKPLCQWTNRSIRYIGEKKRLTFAEA